MHHIHVDNTESVAEHVQRAAIIGYLLAVREGHPNPDHVTTLIVFHDMHEARIGDIDLVQKRYLKVDAQAALADQLEGLGSAGAAILDMWLEVEKGETSAGKIAKDADTLEMALTAREFELKGHPDARQWIVAARLRMQTESGKALLAIVENADPSEWWKKIFKGKFEK